MFVRENSGWVGILDFTLQTISKLLMIIAAALLVLVALLIATDVFGRGLFNTPIIGVSEVVVNGLVIIAFLQLPYTVRIGGMLRSELMDMIAPPVIKRFLWLAGYILGAVLFAILAKAEWGNMVHAFNTGEFEGHVTFAVPVFPSRLAIVTGSILATLTYLIMAIPAAVALFTGQDQPLNLLQGQEVQHG